MIYFYIPKTDFKLYLLNLIRIYRQMSRTQPINQYTYHSRQQQEQKKKTFLMKPANQNQSAKPSTPIRPRLIPTQQLNSTPISVNRKPSQQIPSPLLMKGNKQNQKDNNFRIQPSPARLNINLKQSNISTLSVLSNNSKPLNSVRNKSPILKEKLTISNISPFPKMSDGLKSYMQFGTLPTQKNQREEIPTTKINLNRQASNKTIETNNLQNSNSFKFLAKKNSQAQIIENFGMFANNKNQNNDFQNKVDHVQQKKNKNEILDDIIKNCNKKQQILRTSGSRNDIFTFNQTQPNKLNQSKSFGKLNSNKITLKQDVQQNYFSVKNKKTQQEQCQQIMCLNKDGKKAKYKVVNNSDQEDQQEQNMFYCSNCAIFLIQQGFRVQDIDQQVKQQNRKNIKKNNDLKNTIKRIDDLHGKLKIKNEKMTKTKNQYLHSYEEELNKVDEYYNSLISTIQQIRVKDRESIIKARDDGNQQFQQNYRKVQYCLKKVEQIQTDFHQNQQNLTENCSDQQFNQILRANQNELKQLSTSLQLNQKCRQKQILISEDIQIKFDDFLSNFESSFILKVQKQKRVGNKIMNQKNFSMHFSFEKNKFKNANKKIQNLQQFIKEQSENEDKKQVDDQMIQQAKKPFRNLFPDESQTQNNLQLCEQTLNNNNHQTNLIEQLNQENEQNENYDCYSPNFKNI